MSRSAQCEPAPTLGPTVRLVVKELGASSDIAEHAVYLALHELLPRFSHRYIDAFALATPGAPSKIGAKSLLDEFHVDLAAAARKYFPIRHDDSV